MKGSYVLVLRAINEVQVEVGRLGSLHFTPGYYAYCGSGLGGLEARIARHYRKSKRLHWHIDYLGEVMDVMDVWRFPGTERWECILSSCLLSWPGASIAAARFGSSDCRCSSHLVQLPASVPLPSIEAYVRGAGFLSWSGPT